MEEQFKTLIVLSHYLEVCIGSHYVIICQKFSINLFTWYIRPEGFASFGMKHQRVVILLKPCQVMRNPYIWRDNFFGRYSLELIETSCFCVFIHAFDNTSIWKTINCRFWASNSSLCNSCPLVNLPKSPKICACWGGLQFVYLDL